MQPKVQDVNLKLTEDLQFSMTNFDKLNKGCINTMQINCYMNVCLQSLIACPAFFNMLTLVSENQEKYEVTLKDNKDYLTKFVEFSRYFEPYIETYDTTNYYKKKVVNTEQIFYSSICEFNPENIQADCSEFLTFVLDKLHEEMKGLYVSNEKMDDPILLKKNTLDG